MVVPVTVHKAETPIDYTWMYQAGNSCMRISNKNCTKKTWEVVESHQLWLSATYASMPHIRGYWTEDSQGLPMARAICYNNQLVTTYGDEKLYEAELVHALKDQKLATSYLYTRPDFEDFEVPGLEYDNEWFCLIPKYDFEAHFMITFNSTTKKFRWSQKWSEAPCYILIDGHIPNGAISNTQVKHASTFWR